MNEDKGQSEDITLYNVSEKVAHLQRIFEKAQSGEGGDKATLTDYIDTELNRMLSNVEQATELSFESFERGDTPHVANIKDLLDAKRKIKEARTTFLEGREQCNQQAERRPTTG